MPAVDRTAWTPALTPTNQGRRTWLLAACGVLPSLVSSAATPSDAPGAQRHPWPRQRATPALLLSTLEGTPWRLADLRGRPLLLNFWASWCEPCRAELPSLELLAARHEAQGLRVMTVNFRETDAALRRFAERQPLSLPILRDVDGAAARAFGVRIFPTTLVVGRDGRVLFSVVGEADWTADPARGWIGALFAGR